MSGGAAGQDAADAEGGVPRVPGCYLLLLRTDTPLKLRVGRLGELAFPAGWHVYAGSARRGLAARLRHHLELGRPVHWHVDVLRKAGAVHAVWVVTALNAQADRDGCGSEPALQSDIHQSVARHGRMAPLHEPVECGLARAVAALPRAQLSRGFGSSDCRCAGHLASFTEQPRLEGVWPGLVRAYPPE